MNDQMAREHLIKKLTGNIAQLRHDAIFKDRVTSFLKKINEVAIQQSIQKSPEKSRPHSSEKGLLLSPETDDQIFRRAGANIFVLSNSPKGKGYFIATLDTNNLFKKNAAIFPSVETNLDWEVELYANKEEPVDFFRKLGIWEEDQVESDSQSNSDSYTLHLSTPKTLLTIWNALRAHHDLPELRVVIVPCIIPDAQFIDFYGEYDVAISIKDDYMHDWTLHLFPTMLLMYSLGAEGYKAEKLKRVEHYRPFLIFLKKLKTEIERGDLRDSVKKIKENSDYFNLMPEWVIEQLLEKYTDILIKLLGAHVDSMSNSPLKDYTDNVTIQQCLKNYLDRNYNSLWASYFQNALDISDEMDFLYVCLEEIFPLIDAVASASVEMEKSPPSEISLLTSTTPDSTFDELEGRFYTVTKDPKIPGNLICQYTPPADSEKEMEKIFPAIEASLEDLTLRDFEIAILEEFGFQFDMERSIISIPNPKKLLEIWNAVKDKYNLPDLRICLSRGIAGDLDYINSYFTFDVILSMKEEYLHDVTVHLIPTLLMMYSLEKEKYEEEKRERVAYVKPFFDKLVYLKSNIEREEGKFPRLRNHIDKIIKFTGAIVDIMAAEGIPDRVETYKKNHGNIGQFIKKMFFNPDTNPEYMPFFCRKFGFADEETFLKTCQKKYSPLIDAIMQSIESQPKSTG